MNPTTSRRGILAACLAAVLMSVAGGCGTDTEDPRPDPTPPYDEMPQNLCNRLRSEDLFRRFGLTLAPALDHHTTYSVGRTHWFANCIYVAHATDGRFTTKLGGFEPVGGIQVRVYDDVPGAVEAYNQDAIRYVDLWDDTTPGTTTADRTGWWEDSGISFETVEDLDANSTTGGGLGATQIDITHLVRDENLVVMAYVQALTPTAETDTALAFLHDLTDTLTDQTARRLGR
ncbi:hypothetical protein [Solwaraspora sp. WMMA2065]|uniref:hypothetical protein n=1 Tax=Solwaraspora sp. WMMA2065 TaxID=3015166 RepID=UPI00259BB404|nr:hypothetical protein [Solwaraspora sp. WMMA2065]WJK33111.1 hypothetical protein O7610_20645 [Solwaraspora sp. WMMA2065]